MTLKNVRGFIRAVTTWCADQDDLTGFTISLAGEGCPVVAVDLFWSNRTVSVDFSVFEIRRSLDIGDMVGHLAAVADIERATIARRAVPPECRFGDVPRPPG